MGSQEGQIAMRFERRARRAIAAFAACSLLLPAPATVAVLSAQAPAPNPAGSTQKPAAPAPQKPAGTASQKPAATAATAAPGTASAPVDGNWPRIYDLPSGGTILMYQPQVASWDNWRHMVAFSAVSHRATGADKPALGTVKLEADTEVALTERLVSFAKMKIVEASFPTLNKDQISEVAAVVEKVIPTDDRVIALDRVLANVDKSGIIPKNVEGIKADPPAIFFSKTPAVIVNLDGEPIWSPIKDNDLKFAVNTNWDLFQHVPSNTYYLRNNANWFKAPDAVKGPWAPAGTLPDSFKKLPPDENWNDVRANLPGKPVAASAMPKVFTSLQPAELILVTGEPNTLRSRGPVFSGSATRRATSSASARPVRSTTWSPAAGSRRPTSRVRGRSPRRRFRRISRRSRWNIRGRACWLRCPAPMRRRRRCCSRRFRRPRASTRRRSRRQTSRFRATRNSRRSSRRPFSAP